MMRATVLMPALGTCISWQARIEVATTRSFDQLVIFLGVIYWRLYAQTQHVSLGILFWREKSIYCSHNPLLWIVCLRSHVPQYCANGSRFDCQATSRPREAGRKSGGAQPPAQCVLVEVRIVGVRLTRARIPINKGSAEACGFAIWRACVLNVSVDSFTKIRKTRPNVTLISRPGCGKSNMPLWHTASKKARAWGRFRSHRRRGDSDMAMAQLRRPNRGEAVHFRPAQTVRGCYGFRRSRRPKAGN